MDQPTFRPDQVISLGSTDKEDPFLAAGWVDRTRFQQLVNANRPAPLQSKTGRGGGRGTGHGTSAKRKKAPKPRPVIDDGDRGELTAETILGWGSGSESRNKGPARRGRV